jgi:hypothetical protein
MLKHDGRLRNWQRRRPRLPRLPKRQRSRRESDCRSIKSRAHASSVYTDFERVAATGMLIAKLALDCELLLFYTNANTAAAKNSFNDGKSLPYIKGTFDYILVHL